MTRINVVPPNELHDKHLIAEYKELPRLFRAARELTPTEKETITSYRLGEGHVRFFYDKLQWAYLRQIALVAEMKHRGFKPNYDPVTLLDLVPNACLFNNWEPTPDSFALNRLRLLERQPKQ